MYEMYLAHHGILGMKWGLRRYQNKDGSLTPAGKTRYGGQQNPRHKPSSARKVAKQRAAALEKARQVRAEKKAFEEARQKALKSGNATEVLKYKDSSTRAELQEAYNRISTERSLMEISAKETAKGKSQVDKVLDEVNKWADRANRTVEIWNKAKKVKSLFEEQEKKRQEQEKKEQEKNEKEISKKKARMIALAVGHDYDNKLNYDTLNKLAASLTTKELEEILKGMQENKKKPENK